ncbi:MAG: TonB C-terminal domain-containing protein [Novosphingobium sp.]|nr:TonB C-terminal domain-containing protein [Novosphingobium sp.]
MAARPPQPEPETEGGARKWLPLALGGVVLVAVLWYVISQLSATSGVKVEAPPPQAVEMLPPPPPPPPPPPHPPEPQAKPDPAPVPNSEPPKPAAAPVTINGPAQAGSDSFGLQSGAGGGLGSPGGTGTCVGLNCGAVGGGGMGEVFYRRYLSAVLQERISRDNRLNRLVFAADFAITISPGGRITAASLLKSSGSGDRDAALRSVLMAVSNLDPPPSGVRFPQRITVRGKRAI